MITLDTFEDRLDRWGGALERWPPAARGEAEALLAGSVPARRLHAAMLEVERALVLPVIASGHEHLAAVATLCPQERPSVLRRAPPMLRRAGWGAAIAAALVLGILVGDANLGGHDESRIRWPSATCSPARWAPPRGSWMWIDRRVLFAIAAVSLLLNVFLGGVVLGRVFGEQRHAAVEPTKPAPGALVPPAHVQALPVEQRRRFQAAMAPHRPAIRAAREAHRAARRQIEVDIAAPDFDRAKVTADFDALKQSNRNSEEAFDAALIDALAELSADSRAALVAHVDPRPVQAGPKTPQP